LELKLTQASDDSARYSLSICTPDAEMSASAVIHTLGAPLDLGEWQGGVPPAWLQALAQALLRSALRTKNSDGEWPRRITRWRPEPSS
jgi:hypothetical protein